MNQSVIILISFSYLSSSHSIFVSFHFSFKVQVFFPKSFFENNREVAAVVPVAKKRDWEPHRKDDFDASHATETFLKRAVEVQHTVNNY